MKVVFPICCGVDVHKTFVVATIITTPADSLQPIYQKKRFSTFNSDLNRFADWLLEHGCLDVCMESTGKYWVPVFNILEKRGIQVVIANPKWVKAVKGNKDDTLVILVTFVLACGLAELTRGLTHYRSMAGNLVSFVLFSLGMVGSPLPIWLMREDFLRQITEQGMPADYINTLASLSSNGMLVVLFLAPIVGAIIGGFLARAMFRKHFEKAGLV